MTHEIEEAWEKYKEQFPAAPNFAAMLRTKATFYSGYQAALPKWRDISTAPRDGTRILTYRAERTGSNPVMAENFVVGSKGCPNTGWWYTRQDTPWTHWQPLPSPPKVNES